MSFIFNSYQSCYVICAWASATSAVQALSDAPGVWSSEPFGNQGIPVLPGRSVQTSWDGIDNGWLFRNEYFPNGADQRTHITPMPMLTKLPIQNGFAKGWHLLQLHGRFGLHHSRAQKEKFGLQWGNHCRYAISNLYLQGPMFMAMMSPIKVSANGVLKQHH